MVDLSGRIHYHIRWTHNGVIDWEPFMTEKAADENAKRLARRGEPYEIKEYDKDCERCAATKNIRIVQ